MSLLLLAFSLVSEARAACTKDTDCKGDRVCNAGVCEDPSAPSPAPKAKAKKEEASADLRLARRERGSSLAKGIVGWSLMGTGATFAVAGSAMGLAGAGTGASVGVGGVGLVSLAIAGPIAGGSGSKARSGLRWLGEETPSSGLRVAGWSCYGTGMFLGVIAVGVGATGNSAGGAIGIVATVPAALGTTFLLMDAGRVRDELGEQIERQSAGPPPLELSPVAFAVEGGGGVGLAARW